MISHCFVIINTFLRENCHVQWSLCLHHFMTANLNSRGEPRHCVSFAWVYRALLWTWFKAWWDPEFSEHPRWNYHECAHCEEDLELYGTVAEKEWIPTRLTLHYFSAMRTLSRYLMKLSCYHVGLSPVFFFLLWHQCTFVPEQVESGMKYLGKRSLKLSGFMGPLSLYWS